MRMRVYVRVPVCMCVHVHDIVHGAAAAVVCAGASTCRVSALSCTHVYVFAHVCMYVRTYGACMYVCVYVRMYVCIYVCMCKCMHNMHVLYVWLNRVKCILFPTNDL